LDCQFTLCNLFAGGIIQSQFKLLSGGPRKGGVEAQYGVLVLGIKF